MILVKSYFAAIEYHRNNCYLCNQSNCLFIEKFFKKDYTSMSSNFLLYKGSCNKKFDAKR